MKKYFKYIKNNLNFKILFKFTKKQFKYCKIN